MADHRESCEWRRAASVLCLLANIHRDKKSKPTAYEIDDFYRFEKSRRPAVKMKITILKDMFNK